MKAVKNILVVLLSFVVLAESVGIQIIKDMCKPCQNELVTVQLAYTQYESDCHDGCHAEENHTSKKIHRCADEGCSQQDHEHEKDVQVLNKYPEFFVNNTINLKKLVPVLTVVFNNQISNPFVLQQTLCFNHERNKPIPPDNDIQSFLCTYLI